MNKVILVGRLTKDPELRATTSGIPVCSFTVACDRRFVKQGEERKADFINCIAWRQ
ncbi:MAG: single-stranded DNA-binding protein, partial [Clostridiales bacterium]|nr:single-stranded DNA-binding protein [Clostridiales bacterium]MBD8948264.1 single-stranded DNA-binding protein [Clostridiales bacterium]